MIIHPQMMRSPLQDTLSDGLIGYWPLGASHVSGSTVYDESTNSNNGSIIGSVTTSTSGGKEFCSFAGGSNTAYIGLGDPSALALSGAFAISAFLSITRNTFTSNTGILARWVGYTTSAVSRRSYNLFIDYQTSNSNPKLVFSVSSNGSSAVSVISVTTLSTSSIYHVVALYSPGQYLKLYLNGSLEATNTTSIPLSLYTGTSDCTIGSLYYLAVGQYSHNGLIRDVRLYNRVLTISEIYALSLQ